MAVHMYSLHQNIMLALPRLSHLQKLQIDGWCHLCPQLLHNKVQAQGAIPLEGSAKVADVAGVDGCACSHALAVHLLEQGVDLVPVTAAAEVGQQDCIGDGVGLHSWGVGRAGRGAAGWMASVSAARQVADGAVCLQAVLQTLAVCGTQYFARAHSEGWQCCAWHVLPGRSVRLGAVPSLAFMELIPASRGDMYSAVHGMYHALKS
jgi:hypothetical protein